MTHPYRDLPDRQFWRRFVSDTPWRDLDVMDPPSFRLGAQHRVATAGSCFAQHITRHMKRHGLQPHAAEPAHPLVRELAPALAESYGAFSARYGNVYTVRQMLELLRQAAGTRPMVQDFVEDDGRWYDLLRPAVQPDGWASWDEAMADRAWHLQCVRRMFQDIDVFVFTLGLTESWYHAEMGHTYPVCPGTVRGQYDARLHRFQNFRSGEVASDLRALVDEARAMNPSLRFIFTVSPVPLVATRGPSNVLVASSQSKAVLRAVVGEVVAETDGAEYFPSFEIVSHAASFGQYLAADLREVTERGVAHVMSCFLKAFYGDLSTDAGGRVATPESTPVSAAGRDLRVCAPTDGPPAECEELFYERAATGLKVR